MVVLVTFVVAELDEGRKAKSTLFYELVDHTISRSAGPSWPQPSGCLMRPTRRSTVSSSRGGASLRQRLDQARSDTAGTAGNHRDLPLEVLHGTDVTPHRAERIPAVVNRQVRGRPCDKQFESKGRAAPGACDGPADRGRGRVGGML